MPAAYDGTQRRQLSKQNTKMRAGSTMTKITNMEKEKTRLCLLILQYSQSYQIKQDLVLGINISIRVINYFISGNRCHYCFQNCGSAKDKHMASMFTSIG